MDTQKSFLGTGWAFPPEFSKTTGRPLMVSEEEDIWQSLQILFSTSRKERRILLEYGCNLEEFIFAPLNVSLMSLLESVIREGIQLHEPRIKLDSLTLSLNEAEGRLDVLISYTVRSTNTRFNRVYPYYYQEGTNVEI